MLVEERGVNTFCGGYNSIQGQDNSENLLCGATANYSGNRTENRYYKNNKTPENRMFYKGDSGFDKKCFICGGPHLQRACPRRDRSCWTCGETGHYSGSQMCSGNAEGKPSAPADSRHQE